MEQIKPGIYFQKINNAAHCILNEADKSVNSLNEDIVSGLMLIVEKVKNDNSIELLYIRSEKNDCFCAGADIKMFEKFKTEQDGRDASFTLNKLFSDIENLKIPTIALIQGTCLGGGLELALACHFRIGTPDSIFGLPEIQLGIIPGGGGTHRLPKIIGLTNALDLILTGRKINAKKAEGIGLVDLIVPPSQLCESYEIKKNELNKIKKLKSKNNIKMYFMDKNILFQKIVYKKSIEQIQKNTKGFYPAPLKALDSVLCSINSSQLKSIEKEAMYFGELAISSESKALVHIFKMITEKKKNPFEGKSKKDSYVESLVKGSKSVGILGAGLMGSGIATVLAENGVRSVLMDRAPESLSKGLESIKKYFNDKLKKKKIKKFQFENYLQSITPTVNYHLIKGSPFIIEAVYEDVKIKQDVLNKCYLELDKNFIFATNTSSIPISDISKGYKYPENIVGMHFFSPVPKMPLIEIIKTDKTSESVLSDTFKLAKLMKKNVIVVNDSPGFFTTRVLAFYLSESIQLLTEGATVSEIDKAIEKIGFPVGPLTLIDEVGIDVGIHILNVLKPHYSERLLIPKEMDEVMSSGRRGRKNGFGFYEYKDGKKGDEDPTIYNIFKPSKTQKPTQDEIANRCLYVFLNESARCFEDKVISSPTDGDFGSIFGLGFPPFLGGPFHYARSIGVGNVIQKLESFETQYGKQFQPSPVWKNI